MICELILLASAVGFGYWLANDKKTAPKKPIVAPEQELPPVQTPVPKIVVTIHGPDTNIWAETNPSVHIGQIYADYSWYIDGPNIPGTKWIGKDVIKGQSIFMLKQTLENLGFEVHEKARI